eukprot:scaffold146999_cov51-Prasinocladus_malaysianus.AAC.1
MCSMESQRERMSNWGRCKRMKLTSRFSDRAPGQTPSTMGIQNPYDIARDSLDCRLPRPGSEARDRPCMTRLGFSIFMQ